MGEIIQWWPQSDSKGGGKEFLGVICLHSALKHHLDDTHLSSFAL